MKYFIFSVVGLIGLVVLLGATVFPFIFSTAPHMKKMVHLRTYQMIGRNSRGMITLPPPQRSVPADLPEGTAPSGINVSKSEVHVDTQEESPAALREINRQLEAGRVYYTYYCVQCHGRDGRGNGPVAESYVPAPGALKKIHLLDKSDAEVGELMLQGVGHAPALDKIVPAQHRQPLIKYVKSLAP